MVEAAKQAVSKQDHEFNFTMELPVDHESFSVPPKIQTPEQSMSMQSIIHKQSHTLQHLKIGRLKSAFIATAFKEMKVIRIFLPVIAMMAIALSTIPAQSAPSKIKIGVAMSNFDDVWLN